MREYSEAKLLEIVKKYKETNKKNINAMLLAEEMSLTRQRVHAIINALIKKKLLKKKRKTGKQVYDIIPA